MEYKNLSLQAQRWNFTKKYKMFTDAVKLPQYYQGPNIKMDVRISSLEVVEQWLAW